MTKHWTKKVWTLFVQTEVVQRALYEDKMNYSYLFLQIYGVKSTGLLSSDVTKKKDEERIWLEIRLNSWHETIILLHWCSI